MTRPTRIDPPAFPDVEERIGENPAQWLLKCRHNGAVTDTVTSLLAGMESLQRLDGWIEVERQLGPATFIQTVLAERRRDLLTELGRGPSPQPAQAISDVDKTETPRSTSVSEPESTGSAGITVREDTESQPSEFWGTIEDALMIARAIDDNRIQSYLDAERNGPQRPVVLEALEHRLEELGETEASDPASEAEFGVMTSAV